MKADRRRKAKDLWGFKSLETENILVLLALIGELGKMFSMCLVLHDCITSKYIHCVNNKK